MADNKNEQMARIARYTRMIEKQTGRAVRPFRADGYYNLLNKYGTEKDSTEHYQFQPEAAVDDQMLTAYYEGNGLFAKIIDTPADEAIKHGFEIEGIKDTKIVDFYTEALEELSWEDNASDALRWARLFGGSIAILLVNDGRGIEEPLDWQNIQSIDDIRVYDRSVIQPDYKSMYKYDPQDPFRTRGSRLGMPEYYYISSKYGNFTVHESRCLVFQNGRLPENTSNSLYQLWGLPEYIRINRAIRDAEVAHGSSAKLLDRSIQAVYSMKDLSAELATDEGENRVLRRLQTIDMARGLLNSIVIDSEGENYDFRTFPFTGVSDVIDTTCNFLSALTSIPQTILFGRSPAGMNSTGASDLENYYNYVEKMQKRMLKNNLRYLLSVIFQAGVRTGEIDEVPKIKLTFNPLWSLSDTDKANLEQTKASIQLTKAQTAAQYVDLGVLDPTEIRRKLADSDEFDIDTVLDEYESEEDLFANMPQQQQGMPGMEGAEGAVPGQGQEMPLGDNVSEEELELAQAIEINSQNEQESQDTDSDNTIITPEEKADTEANTASFEEKTSVEEHSTDPGKEGSAAANAPAATKLPQDMSKEELNKVKKTNSDGENLGGVGVLVVKDGKILIGLRKGTGLNGNLYCGPGGHVEKGETPLQAAYRETEEEFGISPKNLVEIGKGNPEPDTGLQSTIFICTDYVGEPKCLDGEMRNPEFADIEKIEQLRPSLFQPFADSIDLLKKLHKDYAYSEDNNLEKSDKTLDFHDVCDIVTLRDYILQLNNDLDEHEDMGVKGMKWGQHKLSKEEHKKIESRVKGHISSNGTEVKSISYHAFDRIGERKISVGQIEKLLDSENVSLSESNQNCDVYDIPGKRLVMDRTNGTIISVMWRRENK